MSASARADSRNAASGGMLAFFEHPDQAPPGGESGRHFIEKPVDPDRLTELVRAALTASEPAGDIILHVDDDRDIREVVATALAGVGEVVSAETLAQARAFLAERTPALVIMDLELRDGSGLELLKDLKDEEVPVIIFSAQDTPGDFARPVTAVLVKSRTSLAGLVGAVRDLVEQKEQAT